MKWRRLIGLQSSEILTAAVRDQLPWSDDGGGGGGDVSTVPLCAYVCVCAAKPKGLTDRRADRLCGR